MVLQSPLLWNLHGSDRLRYADLVFKERPIQCAILRGAILLYRGRSGLLLCCDLCHPIEDDTAPWERELSHTAEVDFVDLRHMRCDCNCSADPGCRSSRVGLFESEKPQHIQQHPVGRIGVPGIRLLGFRDIVFLVLVESMERHVVFNKAVRSSNNGCHIGSVSENLLSTGGDSAGQSPLAFLWLADADSDPGSGKSLIFTRSLLWLPRIRTDSGCRIPVLVLSSGSVAEQQGDESRTKPDVAAVEYLDGGTLVQRRRALIDLSGSSGFDYRHRVPF